MTALKPASSQTANRRLDAVLCPKGLQKHSQHAAWTSDTHWTHWTMIRNFSTTQLMTSSPRRKYGNGHYDVMHFQAREKVVGFYFLTWKNSHLNLSVCCRHRTSPSYFLWLTKSVHETWPKTRKGWRDLTRSGAEFLSRSCVRVEKLSYRTETLVSSSHRCQHFRFRHSLDDFRFFCDVSEIRLSVYQQHFSPDLVSSRANRKRVGGAAFDFFGLASHRTFASPFLSDGRGKKSLSHFTLRKVLWSIFFSLL